jgi:F-type H+-transporting ATPase subunit epsilon
VSGGETIEIVSREAIVDDDLERLESTVLAEFRQRDETEQVTRTESKRMELEVLREIMRYLRPERSGLAQGGL